MKYSITIHKVVALIGLLVLSYVQFFLLYNTYELKNDHYFLAEKTTIGNEYSNAIKSDKVMPGGQKILDSFIDRNLKTLEFYYLHAPAEFDRYKQKICDSAFDALRKANNMDSLLDVIIRSNRLNKYIKYAVLVSSLDVAFKHDKWIPLSKEDVRIGGTLQDLYPQSLATSLSVSSSVDYSYRISFKLYVDTYNRKMTILKLMLPAYILSVLSILSVVLIFFVTFRNWLRQKKLSEMKSDFINSITHEFHTPLSAIIVANKTMQNETILSNKESLRPLTEVVQRQAERLKILISQVLQITTLNKISLKKEEYSIHHLLDELLLDYRLNLMGADVSLTLHKNALRDTVSLDQFWFATIFLNIFDNAIKYNQKESKEITVSTASDKKGIVITIEDNGVGMTGEVQKHIFEKFYRKMDNANAQTKGLGLGLFYVKQAIDAHNWKIDIESTEGEGSVFIISIPFMNSLPFKTT